MAKTVMYIRTINTTTAGGGEFQRNAQIQACSAAGILAGLPSKRDRDGEPKLLNAPPMVEPVAASDRVFKEVVGVLEPADALIVSTLAVFGDVPSKLVANLSKVVATGARIIVADMPSVDIQTIRQVSLAFLPLEEKAGRLSNELDSFYANRAEERVQYARDVKAEVIQHLLKQGIDLTALLAPDKKAAKQPDDPVHGRQLRHLREQLELSGEEAGKLATAIGGAALSKGQVSAIESGRDTGERADNYETALRAELAKRKVQTKMDRAIAKQSGPALTSGEVEFMERVVKPTPDQQAGVK